MPIPKFFSVERKGYTKVSDLFYDVMQDMLEHGFTFINCSNAHKDRPLTFWHPTVVSSTTGKAIGNKLYIRDGTRPTYAGTERPAPHVSVTSVSNGAVTSLSNVISSYDFPIWITEPTAEISLSSDPLTFVDSGVKVTLANITAQSNRTATTANVIYAPSNFSFTLEAGGDIDPLNGVKDPNSLVGADLLEANKQPWRIQFVISEEQKASAAIATKLQMFYDEDAGRIKISQVTNDSGAIIDNVGITGAQQTGGIFSDSDLNQGIYNRKLRVANQPQTFPLSYVLSICDHGFFLGIYEGSWSTTRANTTANSNYFNWVLVQRPVDRGTGRTLTAGKAPVFHVNSVNYKYYKAVVRESDILHPTISVPADSHTPDSHAIFNSVEQVALTEDKTYLLSFPHNLTTPRFRYTEELDMVGTTSSDVVMNGQDIQFKTYGEPGPRTYRALSANNPMNTGLRIAVLWAPQGPRWVTPGGEVSPTDLGQITAGSQPGTILSAEPVPVIPGETPRQLPTFRLERGALPYGLTLEKIGDNWQIRGTVIAADYSENTVIKFTIAAVNVEDTGYSLKDFYFTYII
jgi:hypothetical protein